MRAGLVEATIAAGFASALLDFAASKGASPAALLAKSGLDGASFAAPDARIPLARYVALLAGGAEICREPAFALQFGEAVRLEEVSIAGLIGASAATMGEGLAQFNRYARLMLDAGETPPGMFLELVRDQHGLWLQPASPAFASAHMLVEAGFARFVCGVKRGGVASFPKEVHFTHAEPHYRAEYDRIFGASLTFGSVRNAVRIDEAFLEIALPPPNRYVFGVLSERAEALLKELETAQTIRAQVERILIPILHKGEATMDAVAERLGMSRPTLYRRLRDEDVRYEDIVDGVRRTLALHYLEARKVSVAEAAYLVGFSDASTFSRAFKRWTGKRPGEWPMQ